MPSNPPKAAVDVSPYQLFMLTLCIWALTVLGADTFFGVSDSTAEILQYADTFVCVLFLGDRLAPGARSESYA